MTDHQARITTDPRFLLGRNVDVTVTDPAGVDVWRAVTAELADNPFGVSYAHATAQAERLLAEGGWQVISHWNPIVTGLIADVRPT